MQRRGFIIGSAAMLASMTTTLPALAHKLPIIPAYIDQDEREAPGKLFGLEAALQGVSDDIRHGRGVTFASIPEDVFFENPSSALLPSSMEVIQRISYLLLNDRKVWLEIIGHSHKMKDPAAALAISQRRAVAIEGGLLSRRAPMDRIVSTGLADSWPVTSESTPWDRSRNRRIELVFRPL